MKTYKKMVIRKAIEYQGETVQIDRVDWDKLREGFIVCGLTRAAADLEKAKAYPVLVYSH